MKTKLRPKLFETLKGYSSKNLLTDTLAGLGVGIVALPLAIAFGIASGVSPEQGLITAIIGGLLAAIFGGSSVQVSGPTGAFIVIVIGVLQKYGLDGLLVATMLAGIILILLGVLRLGTIIKFIPYPIVVGFTSGIAIILLSSQMKDFLGFSNDIVVPSAFFKCWESIIANISHTNLVSIGLVVITILVAIFSKKVTKLVPGSLIAIITTTIIVYIFRNQLELINVETIGDRFVIAGTIPAPKLPAFNLSMIGELLPSAFTIAVLGSVESLLSATVADGITGNKTDSNTELIGQGIANIATPLFGGIPVTGAIARTMTNVTNGGRTPVSAIVHAILLIGVLLFLMPLVKFIPMAALAGVLFIVAYNMSEWRTFKAMVKTKSPDVIVLVITFVLTVTVDLTVAIEIGMLFAALLFLKRISEASGISKFTDSVTTSRGEEKDVPKGVEVYEIEGPFFFGVANKFEEVMSQTSETRPQVRIIRMRQVPFIDTTGLHNLEILIQTSHKENIIVILSGVQENVRKELHRSQLIMSTIPEENICDRISIAIGRAKELIKI